MGPFENASELCGTHTRFYIPLLDFEPVWALFGVKSETQLVVTVDCYSYM